LVEVTGGEGSEGVDDLLEVGSGGGEEVVVADGGGGFPGGEFSEGSFDLGDGAEGAAVGAAAGGEGGAGVVHGEDVERGGVGGLVGPGGALELDGGSAGEDSGRLVVSAEVVGELGGLGEVPGEDDAEVERVSGAPGRDVLSPVVHGRFGEQR